MHLKAVISFKRLINHLIIYYVMYSWIGSIFYKQCNFEIHSFKNIQRLFYQYPHITLFLLTLPNF